MEQLRKLTSCLKTNKNTLHKHFQLPVFSASVIDSNLLSAPLKPQNFEIAFQFVV